MANVPQLNLNVLKRHDKAALAINDTSSHVVVYDFDGSKWSKRGIEGSLFLYERSCAPRYAFTVMNRLGVENLTVYCTGDYVIMKDNADEEITGLWMYEESDRARLASKLASYSQQNHRHQFPASNAPPNQHLEDTPQQQEQQHMAMSQPVSLQQLSALTQQPVGAQQGIHPPPQQHSINGKIDVMGMLQNAVMNTQPHSNIVHQNGIGVGPQQPVAPPQQYPVRNINDIFDRIDMCFMPPHSRDYPLNQHDFSARLNVLLTDKSFLDLMYSTYTSREPL